MRVAEKNGKLWLPVATGFWRGCIWLTIGGVHAMIIRIRALFLIATLCFLPLTLTSSVRAQQTLGGVTGTVQDSSGGAVANTTVTIVGDQTKLTRTQKTDETGGYTFVNLPIGSYTLTFSHDGFDTQ